MSRSRASASRRAARSLRLRARASLPHPSFPLLCLSRARARRARARGARARAQLLLGHNGYIWIARAAPDEWKADDALVDAAAPLAESLQRQRERHAATDTLPAERRAICRCRNAVAALGAAFLPIVPDSIVQVYRASERAGMEPKDMLGAAAAKQLVGALRAAPAAARSEGGGAGE